MRRRSATAAGPLPVTRPPERRTLPSSNLQVVTTRRTPRSRRRTSEREDPVFGAADHGVDLAEAERPNSRSVPEQDLDLREIVLRELRASLARVEEVDLLTPEQALRRTHARQAN